MARIFVVTVPISTGAVQRKPDTNGLDPIKSAEIRIKDEPSEKLQSYGGLNLMLLSSKNFSVAWRSPPPQALNCPSLSSLILVSCLCLPGTWKRGILPEWWTDARYKRELREQDEMLVEHLSVSALR